MFVLILFDFCRELANFLFSCLIFLKLAHTVGSTSVSMPAYEKVGEIFLPLKITIFCP